jgi:formylmethanofuran dehydrogenase subunit E
MDKEFQEIFERAGERHGHLCPSLFFGVRGALLFQKAAEYLGIKDGPVILEATSKCLKDGVMTVLGDDKVSFQKTPGECRITSNSGGKTVRVSVKKDIRTKMNELNKNLEDDTAKYQEEGLSILSRMSDDEIFLVE